MAPFLQPIDLMKALPPAPPALDHALRSALVALSLEDGLGARIRSNRPGGTEEDREAGGLWLAPRLGMAPAANRLLVTNGTQSALALILRFLAEPGELIVAERLTYVVLSQIVQRLRLRIEGIELDEHGLMPEAFETICRTRKPRALYCNPTVQNPTATLMPESRRLQIASIARKHGVAIIEDDVLGLLHGATPRPLAVLAPDVTWYCMSLSKCFALGLRVAYLVPPSAQAAASLFASVENLSSWFPSALSMMVVENWIRSGSGAEITGAIRDEMRARQGVAARVMSGLDYDTAEGALHIWLHLPQTWEPLAFARAAREVGVAIRPSSLFCVDASTPPNAVRISLSSPLRRCDLELGLARVAELMEDTHVAR